MIDLNKKTELATDSVVTLLKKSLDRGVDLGEVSAQVVLAVDYSGSMEHLYRNQSVQDVVERCLAMSLTGLDEDGVVPVYPFHHEVLERRDAELSTYQNFVRERFTERMGGTAYAPVMRKILEDGGFVESTSPEPTRRGGLFRRRATVQATAQGNTEPPIPTLVLFVTDGEPSDSAETKRLIAEHSDKPVFWQFIGIGMRPLLLAELDTMSGRVLDNVGFAEFDPRKTSEDEQARWFEQALEEFMLQWIPAARAKGIIK